MQRTTACQNRTIIEHTMNSNENSAGKTRIIIIDDHPIMRQGLAQLINNESDLEVVFEADSAAQAFDFVQKDTPDLAIVDISLPDKSGLELIKDFKSMVPDLKCLVMSMHDEAVYAERVLRAGGKGYIMKQAGGEKLVQAIRQVLAGGVYASETISARILANLSGGAKNADSCSVDLLTDREFEVFQHIGRGMSTKEIAAQLHISVKTVEVHRVNIKEKLNIGTANELVHFAVRWLDAEKIS